MGIANKIRLFFWLRLELLHFRICRDIFYKKAKKANKYGITTFLFGELELPKVWAKEGEDGFKKAIFDKFGIEM